MAPNVGHFSTLETIKIKVIRLCHRGVVDDLLGEAKELTCMDSLSEIQSGRIEVINTLLENKLKSLKEIDQEILNICELTAINNEVKESEEIVARIIDCQRKIQEAKRRQQMQQSPTVNVVIKSK